MDILGNTTGGQGGDWVARVTGLSAGNWVECGLGAVAIGRQADIRNIADNNSNKEDVLCTFMVYLSL